MFFLRVVVHLQHRHAVNACRARHLSNVRTFYNPMKFGKRLRETVERAPAEWRGLFIDYKGLKKLLKNEVSFCQQPSAEKAITVVSEATQQGVNANSAAEAEPAQGPSESALVPESSVPPGEHQGESVVCAARTGEFRIQGHVGASKKRARVSCSPPVSSTADSDSDTDISDAPPLEFLEQVNRERIPRKQDSHGFFDLLHQELDKVNDFFLEQLEDLIIRSEILQRDTANFFVLCKSQRSFHFRDIENLSRRLYRLHDDLVLLQNYAAVNYLGFRKALKKYDKKKNTRLRRTYLAGVLGTPFFLQSENLRSLILETERRLSLLQHLASSQSDNQDTSPAKMASPSFRESATEKDIRETAHEEHPEPVKVRQAESLDSEKLSDSGSRLSQREAAVHQG